MYVYYFTNCTCRRSAIMGQQPASLSILSQYSITVYNLSYNWTFFFGLCVMKIINAIIFNILSYFS